MRTTDALTSPRSSSASTLPAPHHVLPLARHLTWVSHTTRPPSLPGASATPRPLLRLGRACPPPTPSPTAAFGPSVRLDFPSFTPHLRHAGRRVAPGDDRASSAFGRASPEGDLSLVERWVAPNLEEGWSWRTATEPRRGRKPPIGRAAQLFVRGKSPSSCCLGQGALAQDRMNRARFLRSSWRRSPDRFPIPWFAAGMK